MLHSFFDTDGDGTVEAEEWVNGCFSPSGVALIVTDVVKFHADRKGFAHLPYLMSSMYGIATSPEAPGQKWKRILVVLRDKSSQLADLFNSSLDIAGFSAALGGMYKILVGLEMNDDISGLDIAPFAIFVSMSLVSITRQLAEGSISDMTGPEAFLYAKVFEPEGITVSQFEKLLQKGCAKCETIKQGDIVFQSSQHKLNLIAVGSCSLCKDGRPQMLINAGNFIGEKQFLVDMKNDEVSPKGALCSDFAHESTVAMALEETTVISWDISALRSDFNLNADLPGHEKVQQKFRHLVTMSFARKLLYGQKS